MAKLALLGVSNQMSDPCIHAYEIAQALALHDFPGMPDITELESDIREAYLVRAVEVLSPDWRANSND